VTLFKCIGFYVALVGVGFFACTAFERIFGLGSIGVVYIIFAVALIVALTLKSVGAGDDDKT